ncbi:hypothetical protein SPRG_20420 [Saprolegnia parasitica CBS 223.65]|uniref:Serine-threonine/tyrosine-protein kinase catalytic domain-containing protein n=1 Tax=Saprolegnia parasitica (strain CBS 223.65) TaxID=695850 RepID=A0A067CJ87_SAPPC|nr:hypothetical protein SPRG_20420 [Saprolegnia parasitica CBS 223.65]KDO26877.1 hypothetical protein SPRG_20420 [Saprolegnia parasitica CBS 223.65]|eukprot:XP_012202403.1 hypothetical protein SPRG_20420 [Saprolegnia parasitica CBS 223.65]
MVQLLLEKGAKIEAKNRLFDALRNKCIDDAKRILQNSVLYGNLRDSSKTPLLHLVVATQDLSLLQMLLQKPNLQIDAKDSADHTALAVAITDDNAEVVQALYHAGASIHLVDIPPCDERLCASTPVLVAALRQAASINDGSTAAQLLRLGVSCSLANEKGETAWHMAAAKGHMSILTMLLQQETKDENGIDVTNHNGESPLFVAATGGHADAVKCLLRSSASPHVISNDGSTLLHAAAIGGSMSVLHQVVQCGVNVEACDAMGQTPLHIASEKDRDSAVKYLLDVDANVFAKDKTGKTPLMLATHPLVINTLLQAEKSTKQKASVDRPEDTRGASERVQDVNDNDASQNLLDDDSDSNAANEAGDSPLHLAVQTNDHKTLMSLLRSPSINLDVRNTAGVTPVILAIQMGHRRLATMLQTAANRIIPSVPATDIKMDQSSPIYGTVYKGTYKGRVVAIKTPADESSAQAIIHEMETIQQCNSPYVQQLLAVSDVNSTSPKLLLEYMDAGDLRSYLDAKRLGVPTKVNVSPLEVAWTDEERCIATERYLLMAYA